MSDLVWVISQKIHVIPPSCLHFEGTKSDLCKTLSTKAKESDSNHNGNQYKWLEIYTARLKATIFVDSALLVPNGVTRQPLKKLLQFLITPSHDDKLGLPLAASSIFDLCQPGGGFAQKTWTS